MIDDPSRLMDFSDRQISKMVSCFLFLFLAFTCSDNKFGAGNLGDKQSANCTGDMIVYQVARCNSSNLWEPVEDYCVLLDFHNLKNKAEAI